MSIKIKRFQKLEGAFQYLEELATGINDIIVFRGHANSEYRLINTWQVTVAFLMNLGCRI